jgi:hypothetical protein
MGIPGTPKALPGMPKHWYAALRIASVRWFKLHSLVEPMVQPNFAFMGIATGCNPPPAGIPRYGNWDWANTLDIFAGIEFIPHDKQKFLLGNYDRLQAKVSGRSRSMTSDLHWITADKVGTGTVNMV